MGSSDDQLMQLQDALLQTEDSELYTGDDSVDFNGKPVLKSKTGNWRACLFILATEFCERLAYCGINSNLVTYLTQKLHQGNASAARSVNTWTGTCYLTPLVGAFLADSYWGRYWTIVVFSTVYIIGLITLTLSASIPAFKPPECVGSVCPSATPAQYSVFFVGLYLIALGTGGIKPCVPSFGADQFDETDTNERIAKGSFFNWFFFSISFGALVSTSLLVWTQENVGWSVGFGIPALLMGIAVASLLLGTPFYRFQRAGGSPFKRICQVLVASLWKCRVEVPQDSSLLHETAGIGSRKLEHTQGLEFLDKAAVVLDAELKRGDFSYLWRLCTVTRVEELKILIRLFPIWATGIVNSAAHVQMSTTFIEQGMAMERRIGSFTIPAASLATSTMVGGLFWVPIYDKIIVPVARKFTGIERGFSGLQRIGIGLFLIFISMVFAALVEMKRLQLAKELSLVNENVPVPLNILWQMPQFIFLGIADVFTYVGRLEFFNDQSPDAMRSLCTAFALLIITMGCYLSSLVLTIVTSITTSGDLLDVIQATAAPDI